MPTNEELEQQKNLAEVNKLIFRMHAEAVRTTPPDMRNPIGYDSTPRQDFTQSEPATMIKQYQALCEKMQESLKKAPNLTQDAKDDIAMKLGDVAKDLKALNANLNDKFDDWMGNRRQLDKSSWDKSFATINKSFTALQDKVAEVSATAGLPPKSLDAVQKSLDSVDMDKLQNKTFNSEVSRLKTTLTQQNRMDFGFIKATELGYGEQGTKKIWTKVHPGEAKKIEEDAKKLQEDKQHNVKISAHKDDKEWNEKLADKGGPGLYRSEGSPYYMRVDAKGGLMAVPAPETSFLSKAAQTLAMVVLAPVVVPLLAVAKRDLLTELADEAGKKLRQFWEFNTFEKKMGEMMDFIALDPSGKVRDTAVVMSYDDYSNLGKKDINEILSALKLAETRGIGFDIAKDLSDALVDQKVKGHEKVFEEIAAYKARLLAAKQEKEEAGAKLASPPPTPSVPARAALSDADKTTLSEHVKRLNEVGAALNTDPTAEMKVADLQAKYDIVKAAKDGIAQLDLSHANESEIKEIRAAVDKAAEVITKVATVAGSNESIKKEVAAGAKVPISADATNKDAHAKYQADVGEMLTDKTAALNNREEELGIQRQLEDNLAELNHIDVDPDRENAPTMDFKTAVENAVDHMNYAIDRDDAGAKKEKIEALKETTQSGVDKLKNSADPAHKEAGDKQQEKVDKAGEKLDAIQPAPAPHP